MDIVKLYASLTPEELKAVHLIVSTREDRRRKEFYAAKAARGEKLPNNWNSSSRPK